MLLLVVAVRIGKEHGYSLPEMFACGFTRFRGFLVSNKPALAWVGTGALLYLDDARQFKLDVVRMHAIRNLVCETRLSSPGLLILSPPVVPERRKLF